MARLHHARLALAALAVLSAGCAPEFEEKVSELRTMRVLAVQKDKPYAKSGETVNLSILWRDVSDKAPRPTQLWWNKGCYNPAGDIFLACFAPETVSPEFLVPTEAEGCGPPPPPDPPQPEPRFPLGPCDNKLTFTLPADLGQRPPATDPTQPRYGLAYVFFAVCAGRLDFVQQTEAADFPIGCFDENNNRLGADDFVAGYTSIYAYDELGDDGLPLFTNNNPGVVGFTFKDHPDPVTAFCVGDECLRDPNPDAAPCIGDACLSDPNAWRNKDNLRCDDGSGPQGGTIPVPCVPACEDDGDEACPDNAIKPVLDTPAGLAAYPEKDSVSNRTRGRDNTEQMWIDYYAEAGGVKSEVRLLNDAFAGVNDDFGTEFWAPKKPGPTVIWGVVHDNRGGMSWVGMPVLITEKTAPTP